MAPRLLIIAGPHGSGKSSVCFLWPDSGAPVSTRTIAQRINDASLANIRRAVQEMDTFLAYDNSEPGGPPQLVMEAAAGQVTYVSPNPPRWLVTALDLPE